MPSGMTHPQLVSVAASAAADEYVVTLRDADGSDLIWNATIVQMPDGVGPGASFDPGPDPCLPWHSDAESTRSIVAAVVAVHRARHHGR